MRTVDFDIISSAATRQTRFTNRTLSGLGTLFPDPLRSSSSGSLAGRFRFRDPFPVIKKNFSQVTIVTIAAASNNPIAAIKGQPRAGRVVGCSFTTSAAPHQHRPPDRHLIKEVTEESKRPVRPGCLPAILHQSDFHEGTR
jgi:hypothetical protein